MRKLSCTLSLAPGPLAEAVLLCLLLLPPPLPTETVRRSDEVGGGISRGIKGQREDVRVEREDQLKGEASYPSPYTLVQ